MENKRIVLYTSVYVIASLVFNLYFSFFIWTPFNIFYVYYYLYYLKWIDVNLGGWVNTHTLAKNTWVFIFAFVIFNSLILYLNADVSNFDLLYGVPLISAVCIYLIQAFNEEILYRYFFFSNYIGSMWKRIIITSTMFTIAHVFTFQGMTPQQTILSILVRFALSIVLCLIFEKHKNTVEVSILHFIYNSVMLLIPMVTIGALSRGSAFLLLQLFMYVIYLYKQEIKTAYHTSLK